MLNREQKAKSNSRGITTDHGAAAGITTMYTDTGTSIGTTATAPAGTGTSTSARTTASTAVATTIGAAQSSIRLRVSIWHRF